MSATSGTGAAVHQRAHRVGAGLIENGYADDVRARNRQRANLGERLLHIRRVGVGHRLYADRRAAADADAADLNLPCFSCSCSFSPMLDDRAFQRETAASGYPFTKKRMMSLYVSSTISPISSMKPAA